MDSFSTSQRADVAAKSTSEPGFGLLLTPTPAPYGRACLSCARAKCKCLLRSGSSGCERCSRLGKECRPSEAIRKRNKTATRLEQKMDGILSLLQSKDQTTKGMDVNALISRNAGNVQNGHQMNEIPGMVDQSTIASVSDNAVDVMFLNPISFARSCPPTMPFTGSNNFTTAASHFAFNADGNFGLASYSLFPSFSEAEKYLADFRTQTLVNLPFIYIPPNTTAKQLRQRRPFLFLAIMAVSSKSTSQRLTLGREIKEMIAREVLVENEGNFDVLLGLLVFLTWGHDQFVNTPLTSRFMQLAISMVFDLRLNKPPDSATRPNLVLYTIEKEEENTTTRAMEERRAVLGCFVLSLSVSWYFAKIDPLRWTPYMDECLQILSTKQEAPTDKMLAQQIRLQLLAEKVAQTASKNTVFEHSEAPKAHLPFYLRALRSQLVDIKRMVSPEVERNQILLTYMHYTELCINALALSNDPLISNVDGLERLDSLSRCLNSIKSWFEIFFTIPPSNYLSISWPMFTQLAHSIIILHRLSTFEDSAWDLGLVRSTMDLNLVLEHFINNLRLMRGHRSDSSEPDMFAKVALVFESAKSWSKNRFIVDADSISGIFVRNFPEDTVHVPVQDTPLMNIMDDAWLSEELGAWSYDFVSS